MSKNKQSLQAAAYTRVVDQFTLLNRIEHNIDMHTFYAAVKGTDVEEKTTGLAQKAHEIISAPQLKDDIDTALSEKQKLSSLEQRNLDLMHKHYVREAALPEDLAKEVASVMTKGANAHMAMKKDQSMGWAEMQPHYARAFNVKREVGQLQTEVLGFDSAYDALLDGFSPGLKSDYLEREFAKLDGRLPEIIQTRLDLQVSRMPAIPLIGSFSAENQMQFNRQMVKTIGFDLNSGEFYRSLGSSASHGCDPDEIRLKVRIDSENSFIQGMLSTIHEAGHGLYEQNLPRSLKFQNIGRHGGIALHESQSMIMEYQVGMSRNFIEYVSKLAPQYFGNHMSLGADNLFNKITTVQPSFIRVDADELTYPMHVSLRFQIERAIIKGELDLKDLPDAWNKGMKERLGIVPKNNREGCLQDIHWPDGAIGYFPAYSIGAGLAAQFMNAAQKEHSALEYDLKEGDLSALREWLHENVHSKGATRPTDQIIRDATGEDFSFEYLLNHFEQRYLEHD